MMRARRGLEKNRLLCSGPGRLTQALAIDGSHDGLSLTNAPFRLIARENDCLVESGIRIGISKAVDHPWRFGLHKSAYLSRKF